MPAYKTRSHKFTSPSQPKAQILRLRILGTQREFAVTESASSCSVGSDESSWLQICDPYVSRSHCRLERRPDGAFYVVDADSRNGTYLDGHRIESAELRPGSILRLGQTRLVALGDAESGDEPSAFETLIGTAPTFAFAMELALRTASSNCNVLIVGETGTGKELVARAIHEASKRRDQSFVAVNCGAIPHELINSELFGHNKGAFTGASFRHDGLFAQANTGTIFLDEIGELPRIQQPHLLRVLESRKVRPVGGQEELDVDVRVIAATNRVDGLGTDDSVLRSDLYHRLATVVIELPPLRERREDIELLTRHFLREYAREYGPRELAPGTIDALLTYDWPGNVRQLRQAVYRAVALNRDVIGPEELVPKPLPIRMTCVLGAQRNALRPLAAKLRRKVTPVDAAVRETMLQAVRDHGSFRKAAAAMGIAKSTFTDRARRLGITSHYNDS